MRSYNLGFISDEDIFTHVKETVEKYRFKIDLKKFNKNLIDPIKLTFDSKIYAKSIEEIIEELSKLSPNLLKSLYLLSFSKYDGFENFEV